MSEKDERIEQLKKTFAPVMVQNEIVVIPEKRKKIDDIAAATNLGRVPHPGQGRRRGVKVLTLALDEVLAENDAKLLKDLARAIIQRAIEGNDIYLKELWNRLEGTMTNKVAAQFDFTPLETKPAYERATFLINALRNGGVGDESAEGIPIAPSGVGGAAPNEGNGAENLPARTGQAEVLPPEPKP